MEYDEDRDRALQTFLDVFKQNGIDIVAAAENEHINAQDSWPW